MSNPVGIALIGCGGMGARHLGAYLSLHDHGRSEGRLTAVCDADPARRSWAADLVQKVTGLQVAQCADLEECLNLNDVEAVDLAVPTHLHRAMTLRAFEEGRHVLVEKPIALTIDDALAMADAAQRHSRVLAIAENFRRVPSNRAFAAWVREGLVGEPYFATSTLVLPSRLLHPDGAGEWYRDRSLSGSLVALEMGVHEMDLIQHWFGPIDRVSALVRTHETRALARDGSEIPVSSDDTCFATVTCESGVDVQLTLTMAGHGQPIGQRLLIGSRGSVTSTCWEAWEAGMVSWDSGEQASTDDAVGRWIGQLDPQARSTLLAEGTWDPDNISVDVSDPLRYGVAAEVLDFILAIQDRRSPEVGAPEAIHALAAALAILESSALGRTVTVASVIDGSVSTWQDSLKALHRG